MIPATSPAMALVRSSDADGGLNQREAGAVADAEMLTNHYPGQWFASMACEVS